MKGGMGYVILFLTGAVFASICWGVVVLHPSGSSSSDIARSNKLNTSFSDLTSTAGNVAVDDASAKKTLDSAGSSSEKAVSGIGDAIKQTQNIGSEVSGVANDAQNYSRESSQLAEGIAGDIRLLDKIIDRQQTSERSNSGH